MTRETRPVEIFQRIGFIRVTGYDVMAQLVGFMLKGGDSLKNTV
jgi:hypothetical protein